MGQEDADVDQGPGYEWEERRSRRRKWLLRVSIGAALLLVMSSFVVTCFKIPSGSMMPTLQTGDNILVNDLAYSVLGEVERGDVIVFRYPVDESQTFMKRVIGLPGDEIAEAGRKLSIKRAGQSEWEVLPRRQLEQRCVDPESDEPIANCTLFEETLDDKTYVVRYKLSTQERNDPVVSEQIWRVPQGHVWVMGDNRNDALDSRRWVVIGEAVRADGLLSTKDLRELTDERLFTVERPATFDEQGVASHDHVVFAASHRALDHDLGLEVWREPSLGAAAVLQAKRTALAGQGAPLQPRGWDALGEGIEALYVGEDADARHAVVQLREPAAVLVLACGKAVCPDEAALVRRLGEVLERLAQDRDREARELLTRPDGPTNYSSQFKSRHNPRDHYHERRFASAEVAGPRGQVRLQAFRRPDDGTTLVRDAALLSVGVGVGVGVEITPGPAAPKPEVDDQGIESWVVEQDDAWVGIAADTAREMVVMLECGKAICNQPEPARAMLAVVAERMPRAADDRRRLPTLLGVADVDGLPEVPAAPGELAEYDRVALEATVKGDSHRLELEVWLRPAEGLPGKIEALRQEHGGMEADEGVLPGAYGKADAGAQVLVLPVPATNAVLRLRCGTGLCPTRDVAVALAQRAGDKALEPGSFIDPNAERPLPFVPLGHVEGRVERIWLPLSRFWLPVR